MSPLVPLFAAVLSALQAEPPRPGPLHVGWASRDITPDRPVALSGQFHKRISSRVEARLFATALALEGRDGDRASDQAVLVACDLIGIGDTIQPRLRERLAGKLEGFDLRKLILSATHTHTAPVTDEPWYDVSEDNVMKPAEYVEFLVGRLAEAAEEAWRNRRAGGVTWGLGYAVVGLNRRVVYADGRAAMYGGTDRPDFRHFEGGDDPGVETLFFFDAERRLTGVAVNVGCPSQAVEAESYVSSDFWHDARAVLRERLGADLFVLPWTGAAGDHSPHPQIRRAADARMRKLQGNLSTTRAIALRLGDAVESTYKAVRSEVQTRVPLAHHVEDLRLPVRPITEAEYRSAKAACDRIAAKPRDTWTSEDLTRSRWHGRVVQRYERPSEYSTWTMELHVLRLGDVAIATNPFELFQDYGVQMKARGRGIQTFLVQLACSTGGYLPTERAVAGGGYSAVPESGIVGPEGGRLLVDRTVEIMNGFWPRKGK